MHTQHPDSHEHGLADGCPRCAEHAVDPVASLDDQNFDLLVGRTVLWMQDQEFPRSDTEKAAMRVIESHLVFCRRMGWRPDAYVPESVLIRKEAKNAADVMFERAFGRKP
jgi:hypothetical protein